MAVPKKRTSKKKTRSRKANWFNKAKTAAQKAWSLGCSIGTGNSNSLIITKTKSDV